MSYAATVFDYETILAAAIVNAFTAGGFDASIYTAQDAPEFQRARPRVEVQFKLGGTEIPIRQLNDGTFRPQAFHGELMVAAITDSNADGKTTHGEYRAKVRSFCYQILPLVNNVSGGLTLHRVNSMIEQGTTQGFAPERGEETSVLSFRVQFSIHGSAWLPAMNVFYGVSDDDALTDPTDLTSLEQTSVTLAVTLTADAEYLYFAFPDALGNPMFTVNGLVNTAWVETAITVEGDDYNIFRSLNLLTGTYRIGVIPI